MKYEIVKGEKLKNFYKYNSFNKAEKMNILLILLGSNISYLLNDRINTAIDFVGQFNQTNVDWFLSGGIKNPNEDTIPESEKMFQEISKLQEKYAIHNKWNYIYDVKATNTAENFIMVKQHFTQFAKMEQLYDEIYVVTSNFHYNRANKISELILDFNPKWILGNAQLEDSVYWENIHIKNVNNDVEKARKSSNV